ncbi:hypothetical protein A3D11_03535 [Candidatus Peribacteria bacterium RIFCSPHIGHO2_02_FULL_49_16]|nr:MAG: hypothetical protein A2880_04495 [Candidatus Peribacteria bacterium RIFCSPHIGHO2_01_FULL_49_38]OGJ58807.1 MAG: hypothetical protein A3D11_03535 [Candidatus Peribacteria bacterium RIFCSPHIGHO2_02_FULL_49_16]
MQYTANRMHKPTIDILMPTYEPQPEHLLRAIDSVFAQTEQNWRLLIHDDASKTDVRSAIAFYLRDPRITFQKSTQHKGIGGNWNACLRFVHAPFIQFLFQDDLWTSSYLERTVNIMSKEHDVSLLSVHHAYACERDIETAFNYQFVLQQKEKYLRPGRQDSHIFLIDWLRRGLFPNVIGEPSFVMLRKSLVEIVGDFREDFKQFLDIEYWVRCLQYTDWYYLTENLGTFRVHRKGTSFQNFQSGVGLTERSRCLWELYKTFPEKSEERHAIRCSLRPHFIRIVKQSIKWGVRTCTRIVSAKEK